MNLLKLELEEIEYKKNKGFILKSQIEENKKLELLKEIILNSQVYNYLNNEYENFFSKSEKIIDFLEYVKKDLNIKKGEKTGIKTLTLRKCLSAALKRF